MHTTPAACSTRAITWAWTACAVAACALGAPATEAGAQERSPVFNQGRRASLRSARSVVTADYVTAQTGQPPAGAPTPPTAQPGGAQAGAAEPSTSAFPPPSQGDISPFAGADDLFALVGPRSRLASTPDMFGDFFGRGGTITAVEALTPGGGQRLLTTRADLPWAGGARGLKVGEHNKALPVDRIYFNYNHYHNALQFQAVGTDLAPPGAPLTEFRDLSLDRYTLGWEKTFWCGLFSVELRMPLSGGYDLDFQADDPTAAINLEGGHFGNLSILPKLLLYEDERTAVSAGLGIEAPTGSDAEARVAFTAYRVENEAVHLHPYLGVLAQPTDRFFVHAFAQLDVAANGNPVKFTAGGLPPDAGTFGVYNEQTLLHLDVSLGRWLYRDPCAPVVTGLACLAEWHYTAALEDTDVVTGARATPVPPGATLDFRNRLNRFDVVNFTAGLHLEIARDTTLRVGGAFPLESGAERFFDAEALAQLSRRF